MMQNLNDVFNVYKLSEDRKTHSLEHDEVFDPEFISAEKQIIQIHGY